MAQRVQIYPCRAEFTIEVGEKVLAFHGPQIYEGKVIKTGMRMGPEGELVPKYLTHYQGWNTSWDEWLDLTRLMKHNEENLERQSKLKESASRKEKKRQSKTSDGRGSSKQAEEPFPKRRRGGDRTGAANAVEPAEAESLVIVIPDRLKLRLIDDWNMVIKQSKLVELPKSPSITDIFDGYCDNVKGCGSAAESLALEVTSGLKAYFESALGPLLLYKSERLQHSEQTEAGPDVDVCTIYGGEHLLRLFVKLPTLIAHARVDERGMAHVQLCVQDILKHMLLQEESLFPMEAYIDYSAEYAKKM